jgi:hypothetical protein
MKKSRTERKVEWEKMVKHKPKQSDWLSRNAILVVGLVFVAAGVFGVVRDLRATQTGNPGETIGHTPRGLPINVTDHLMLSAGFMVVGLVWVWVCVRSSRARKRNSDDKGSF